MNVEDLRLGNFVTVNNPNNWIELKNVPMLVTGLKSDINDQQKSIFLHSNGLIAVKSDFETYNQFSQFIEPIALTKDWLLRFGFKDTPSGFEKIIYNKYRFSVILFKKFASFGLSGPFGLFDFRKPKYVHELQNVHYSVIGKELHLI